MKIIITQRCYDFRAYVEGLPRVWESGKTAMEALGKLINTLSKKLKIKIEFRQ